MSLLERRVAAMTAHGLWVPAFARFRGDDAFIWCSQCVLVGLIAPYCTLSATNRSSPSALDTSNRTDFLPSFFS
jgi:hypothetical protein